VGRIGNPALMEKLVGFGMRSQRVMNLALTILANLEDPDSKNMDQWGLRMMKKLAELRS
jgi:hypothetical protein